MTADDFKPTQRKPMPPRKSEKINREPKEKMSDIVERLNEVQGDNEDAREAAAELERLRAKLAAAMSINKHLVDEVERLRAEAEDWRDRWQAERRDHEATITAIDKLVNEGPR